jgi:hypothetical protein
MEGRKIQKGKCGTARMTPAQEVANMEESAPLLAIAEQSSGRFGLDNGQRAA